MKHFNSLFSEVSSGSVKIEHFSTSSVIAVTVKHTESDSERVLYLDYFELDDLIECIDKLKEL